MADLPMADGPDTTKGKSGLVALSDPRKTDLSHSLCHHDKCKTEDDTDSGTSS